MINLQHFDKQIQEDGWVFFESVLDSKLLLSLQSELEEAYKICRGIQVKNGMNVNTDGSVHHLPCLGGSFISFLEEMKLVECIKSYFNGSFILNSFGGVKNIKGNLSYVGNIHRDIRSFTGELKLMLNMLVLIDDFTIENGATYFLTGSHVLKDKPTEDDFYRYASRSVGKKGSIVLFNSNLWHAAGINTTNLERRALTLTFTKPFMKQQIDYPRAIGYDECNLMSDQLKQILGYNSRIPTNLEEWYQPPEKRLYRPDQG